MAMTAQQPNVDELLAAHATPIAELRASLGELLPAQTEGSTDWDDLWLLRYCLSFSLAAERVTAATKCLAWRKAHVGMLSDAAAGKEAPRHEEIVRLCVASHHTTGSNADEPFYVVRAGLSSPKVRRRLGGSLAIPLTPLTRARQMVGLGGHDAVLLLLLGESPVAAGPLPPSPDAFLPLCSPEGDCIPRRRCGDAQAPGPGQDDLVRGHDGRPVQQHGATRCGGRMDAFTTPSPSLPHPPACRT